MQGFINQDGTKYCYFSDSDIKEITVLNNISLGFDSNYSNLLETDGTTLNYSNVNGAIAGLSAYNVTSGATTKADLVRIIFITSEAIRFRSVNKDSESILQFGSAISWNTYKPSLNNWWPLSTDALRNSVGSNPTANIGMTEDVQVAQTKET